MNILGIETSCDETSAAVVNAETKVRATTIVSSLRYHRRYGGIIPEIAFRMHLETIAAITDCALDQSKLSLGDIHGISVTAGPGLLGSLLVGISFAKGLALSTGLPLIGINHLHSHIYSCFLNKKLPRAPFLSLVVSGGHTSLFYVKNFSAITLVGSTRDDAAGEAFDKVSSLLGLGYPGGPAIEKAAIRGNPDKISFRCSNTKNPFDFSFSGVKTAVLYYAQRHELTRQLISDICASFQYTVLSALVEKTIAACNARRVRAVAVGGGVAVNSMLREMFTRRTREEGITLSLPENNYCTDNAAMVAGMGYWLLAHNKSNNLTLEAFPTERNTYD